jgi:excisionase family DNA binding protein
MESPYMDVHACAAYLGQKPATIYVWVHHKKIPFRKHGRSLRFHKDDLDRWSAAGSAAPRETSVSRFEQVRSRLRSLKTECTASLPQSDSMKGVG